MTLRFLRSLLFLTLATSACAQTVGQYELRKRTSTGFTSYGVTLSNGQVLGQTAGVPAAITVSGGGGAIWGQITGTLTDQTDLNSALSGKSPTAGSASITTLGTITTGTWQGTIIAPAYLGTGSSITTKFLRGDGTWQTVSGTGDALTTNPLSQFAATTSAQLRGVLSDESGTGEFLTTNGSAASLTSFPTLNQNTTGSAATLTTPRAINGVNFDGSAAITVTAAAGTLTGTTLASNVVTSSLTSAAGGTFGTAAFTAATAYEVPLTFSTGLTRTTNTITVNTSAGGNFTADSGKIPVYSSQGQITSTGLRINATDSTSRYALLNERSISFTDVLSSGFSVTIQADAPTNHRSHTFPDRTGVLLHTDGDGSALTALNASSLSSGTVPTARLGSGTANSSTYLRGDNTWATVSGSGDMILTSAQSVTGLKTFDTTKLAVKGSSTGSTAIASANASATNYTATLQAATGTLAYLSDITGTVTSVAQSFTGGLISVAGSPITTSGTLALTVAGTSGGIPYFSSSSTWASSAALAANALVIGGGAGAAPSTMATGTGVITALGVNVGSDGAFVTYNGDAGTPSALVGTNISGTAASLTAGTATAANGLKSATTTVAVSSATAPSSGQVLTATSSTAATWQTPSSGGGKFVQQVYTQDGTYKTTTVAIPLDNTKPQNTEGAAWTEGNTTITPSSATNILCIEVDLLVSASTGSYVILALFQDSTADALATRSQLITSGSYPFNVSFKYFMTAGTTSATTFKVRFGPTTTGYTAALNQQWNTTYFNGTILSTMRITEIAP